jgi:hypothetical protein
MESGAASRGFQKRHPTSHGTYPLARPAQCAAPPPALHCQAAAALSTPHVWGGPSGQEGASICCAENPAQYDQNRLAKQHGDAPWGGLGDPGGGQPGGSHGTGGCAALRTAECRQCSSRVCAAMPPYRKPLVVAAGRGVSDRSSSPSLGCRRLPGLCVLLAATAIQAEFNIAIFHHM